MKSVLLAISNVDVTYGETPILHNVTLQVGGGELVALVGPNGAGKSSLLRAILNFIPEIKGEISVAGRKVNEIERLSLARIVAYVPQILPRNVELSVSEVVKGGMYPFGGASIWTDQFKNSHDEHEFERILEFTSLTELRNRAVRKLSLGEVQRVYLAAAFAQKPQLLLMDEPTSALDPHQEEVVFNMLKVWISQGEGRSVILATHHLNCATHYSSRVVAIGRTEVLFDGVPEMFMNEKKLEEIFGYRFLLVKHPNEAKLMILPGHRKAENEEAQRSFF